MNVHAVAQSAYRANIRTLKSARDIEYDVIARITRQLQAAIAQSDPSAFPALAAAIVENNRLWTVFAIDLSDPGNEFPKQLRAQLFYLAEFVMQHSDKVLNGTAAPGVLVDINLSVMRGLSGKVAPL